ncbi:uncharacterized protein LOC108738022 [Agrilus planipennis]|uniref:Uncharacterized protein LOC108738022 n=1 Tax=Agrilus planipennis TaxID=224129 RepID=A0A1W4X336_AGRPL|nr:uncharacterized protein LOC108738022 [Agrilus planipennis]
MDMEAIIPAFSMWKALNETIPALLNLEYCESNYKKLESIVMSKEFLNLFVFNHDSNLTIHENKSIITKYKAFTMWLLGRFVHILSCDKTMTHNLIVEAQLKILQHLSVTERSVCQEIGAIYVEMLCQLNNFHKNNEQNTTDELLLDLFNIENNDSIITQLDLSSVQIVIKSIESCTMMQQNILKIVSWYTMERLEHSVFNNIFYKALSSQLYVLTNCNFTLKITVLKSFVQLVRFYTTDNVDNKFIKYMNEFTACMEQIVYKVYVKSTAVNSEQQKIFEELLLQFINNTKNVACNLNKNKILEFITKEIIKGNPLKLSKHLKLEGVKNFARISNVDLIDECINSVLNKREFSLLCIIENYIVNYLRQYIKEHDKIKIIKLSNIQNPVFDKIKDYIFNFECKCDRCNVEDMLLFLDQITNITEKIKFKLLSEKANRDILFYFFEEEELLNFFFNLSSSHVENCNSNSIDRELFFRVLIRSLTFYPVSNVDVIFHAVAYPFLKSRKETSYTLKNYTQDGKYNTKQIKISLEFMSTFGLSRESVVVYLFFFLKTLNNVTIQCFHGERKCENNNCLRNKNMEEVYYSVCVSAVKSKNKDIILQIIKHLKYIFVMFNNVDRTWMDVYVPILGITQEDVVFQVLNEIDNILALFYDNLLVYYFDENDMNMNIYSQENNNAKFKICISYLENNETIRRTRKTIINTDFIQSVIQKIQNILISTKNPELKLMIVQKLSSLINFPGMPGHYLQIFKVFICDPDKEVRKALAKELYFVLSNMVVF